MSLAPANILDVNINMSINPPEDVPTYTSETKHSVSEPEKQALLFRPPAAGSQPSDCQRVTSKPAWKESYGCIDAVKVASSAGHGQALLPVSVEEDGPNMSREFWEGKFSGSKSMGKDEIHGSVMFAKPDR